MNLVFITEARFILGVDDKYYGESSFNYDLWKRYLSSFSKVSVMARVRCDSNYSGKLNHLSSGKNVSFIELPHYVGALEYLKKQKAVKRKINESIKNNDDVFICRIPGTIGGLAIDCLNKLKKPFGVEVVGDPWDVFAKGSIKHPLRLYFRLRGYFDLKYQVSKASAVLYVTENKLQNRYPAAESVFQTNASNVKIKDDSIRSKGLMVEVKNCYNIISIGSLEQMYKAPDVVLKALKLINEKGVLCKLIWLGEGIYKTQMANLAKQLGLSNLVEFKGNVGAFEVRQFLLESDIFVLASRTEGLPRAMIEAMAVGLPCVGTRVGGIPELLSNNMLVTKDDKNELADKLMEVIQSPKLYMQQSERNLFQAAKYKESVLNKKRKVFYEYLKNNIT